MAASGHALVGGYGGSIEADEQAHALAAAHKEAIEAQAGEKYETFVAKLTKRQVVAGMNHRIKIHVGGDKYIHATLYDRFGNVSLTSVETGKTEADAL